MVYLSSLAGQKRKQPPTKAVTDSAAQAIEDEQDDRNLERVWNAAHELEPHQESKVYFSVTSLPRHFCGTHVFFVGFATMCIVSCGSS